MLRQSRRLQKCGTRYARPGRAEPDPAGPALRKFPVTRTCKNHGTTMKIHKMLYPELLKAFEAVRWTIDADISWEKLDAEKLSDEQALTIKMNAITEWAALPATEMFLRDNREDSDFCAFMSVWFYEEQKHALVLMEYLRRFRPDLVPSEQE